MEMQVAEVMICCSPNFVYAKVTNQNLLDTQ